MIDNSIREEILENLFKLTEEQLDVLGKNTKSKFFEDYPLGLLILTSFKL